MHWWGFALFAVFVCFALGVNWYRMRRGGPGPAVQGWVPRFMRGKLNRDYRKHGWQEPYDEDGDRNPDRQAL